MSIKMNKKTSFESELEPVQPSRSELKRQSAARQKLGEELAALSPALWKGFSLSPHLLAALQEYGRVKGHEAKRRQLQFIGRLMRDEDCEQIRLELNRLKAAHNLQTIAFHELENLREQILQNTQGIWQELERQLQEKRPELTAEAREKLYTSLRQLGETAARKQDKTGARALFRALREAFEATSGEEASA